MSPKTDIKQTARPREFLTNHHREVGTKIWWSRFFLNVPSELMRKNRPDLKTSPLLNMSVKELLKQKLKFSHVTSKLYNFLLRRFQAVSEIAYFFIY